MEKKKYIVTIARQFGSLGRPIAMRMSEKLGIEFYDRDIVEEAAKKLNLPVSKIDEIEESAKKKVKTNSFRRMMYPLGTQTDDLQNKLFDAQQNIIKFLAERESCIIVGRCSDFILADEPNLLRIYIYAPYEARVANCVNDLNMDRERRRAEQHQHIAEFQLQRGFGHARGKRSLSYALCRISSERSAL